MRRVEVGAWVRIDDCPLEYSVIRDEIEFRVGDGCDGLDLVFTERGLANLLAEGADALHAVHTAREPADT
ncbi:hypothetical protein AB0H34_22285 [Saccharopolyspora shandongensis]|uniref:hypothetical protein n=1 Tax=Saccharopolyspora shandongensis TaxID=418495 RepID=UPI0033CFB2B6